MSLQHHLEEIWSSMDKGIGGIVRQGYGRDRATKSGRDMEGIEPTTKSGKDMEGIEPTTKSGRDTAGIEPPRDGKGIGSA